MCDSDREPVANMNKVFNGERKQACRFKWKIKIQLFYPLFVDFQNRAYLS